MSVERRFQTAAREADTAEPGLVLEDDGTVWLVNPDGSRAQVAGGGGAGLPAQWTVDGAGNLFIQPDVGGTLEAALIVRVPSDLSTGFRLEQPTGNSVFTIDPDGVLSTSGSASFGYDEDVTQLSIDGSANILHDIVQARAPGSISAGVQIDGGLFTELKVAPVDGHLFTSRMVLWFDNTNGDPKPMVTMKDAGGNIVSKEIVTA